MMAITLPATLSMTMPATMPRIGKCGNSRQYKTEKL